MADKLYLGLQQECDLHIRRQVAHLQDAVQLEAVLFLERVDALWQDHCSHMLIIRHIFLYMDRTHVLASTAARSLFDMGLQLLGRHLAEQPDVERRSIEGLLILIERERGGDSVDRRLMQNLLRMLHHLGTYAESFQKPFLEQSGRYYRMEGARLMAEIGVPEYLRHCEARLSEEYARCAHYLDSTTRKPLIQVVEQQLLLEHMAALLDRGFAPLLDGQRVEDVARLYGLALRVGATEAVRVAFRDYIRSSGVRLVKDEEKDQDMFEQLLEPKSRSDEMAVRCMERSMPHARLHLFSARVMRLSGLDATVRHAPRHGM